MEKKTDRRVRKTKNQLRTGPARLMKKKNIGQITVKELVDDVDINRSTFYLHYSDIPSLLKEIEDDMIEEIERAILEHPIKIEKDTTYLFIEDLFRVLSDNREIGCALLGPYGDITFIRRIEKFLEENSRDLLAERFPEKFAEMKYFYSNYKDYYYLPQEDIAIHKSVAGFVDKEFRQQALASNCYTRKVSSYLPQWDTLFTPFFKREYKDHDLFFELTDEFKTRREDFNRYAHHILEMIASQC